MKNKHKVSKNTARVSKKDKFLDKKNGVVFELKYLSKRYFSVLTILLMALLMLLLLQFFYYAYIKTDLINQGLGQADLIGSEKSYDLSCEGCNVLFINVELFRADHVDLINPDKNLTPNIDAFFDKGLVFTNVRSPAGGTYESIVPVFTALDAKLNEHTFFANVQQEGQLLIDLVPSIPQILKKENYLTVNLNCGTHSGAKAYLDRGYNVYTDYWNEEIDKQIKSLMTHLNDFKGTSENFFLQSHFNTLHYPYKMPKYRVSTFKQSYAVLGNKVTKYYDVPLEGTTKIKGGPFDKNAENNVMYKLDVKGVIKDYTFDEYDEMRLEYEEQVKFVDYELDQLFDFLEQNNYLDNTIVVLFANHGDGLFDNEVVTHGVCYESCVHVPLLIRHPKIKEQIIVDDSVGLIDLAPTLYDMLGIQLDYNISGKSFYSELSKKGTITREYTYTTSDEFCDYIKKGNLKLISKEGGIKELYDLSTDPHETKDIYSENRVIAQELEAALDHQKIEALSLLEELKKKFAVPLESN